MFYPLLSTLIYFSSLFSTLRLLNVMKSAVLIEMIIINEVIVKIRLIFALHWGMYARYKHPDNFSEALCMFSVLSLPNVQ